MTITVTMPKKPTEHSEFAENARNYIKALRDNAGGAKPFFELVHDREPVKNESITFNNQINRGNYSAELVGMLVDKLNLESVTLGELYKGYKSKLIQQPEQQLIEQSNK
ncbi:MAG: hypothetical protein HRT35_00890 [Algicola sp.]|nr:hypothetical protein [Algicola sp.]